MIRSEASEAMRRTIAASQSPAPATSVSATWLSIESPSPIAAAMPPCAQAEDAPCPSGTGVSTVQGKGASFSAVKSPARPPPMMRMEGMGVSGAAIMKKAGPRAGP